MIMTTRYQRSTGARRVLMRVLFVISVVAVSFGVGYLLAVRVFFPEPPTPTGGIAVPDVTGMTEAAARVRLDALGLGLGTATGIAHTSVPPGIIVAQAPVPGQQLRRGASVEVGVSTGRVTAPVPDVIGLGEQAASALLARLGFEAVIEPEAAFALPGRVIRTVPAAGERLLLPAHVQVFVSAGRPLPDSLPSGGDSVPNPL